MEERLTLFDIPAQRLKEVKKTLAVLDLAAARHFIDILIQTYPEYTEAIREETVLRFLEDTFTDDKKPAQIFTRFSAFKKLLKELSYSPEYFSDLERAYFGRIVDAFGGSPIEAVYGYPPGYLLLKGGRLQEARESLLSELSQASLPPKKRAHLLGYLGDLYVVRGELEEARRFYVQAILTDWTGTDIKAILDDDVKALILGTYIPEGMGGIWAASVGHILMVFETPPFKDSDTLMSFFKEFTRLKSAMDKDESDETRGRVFYHALVMVESEHLFRALKGADMMELKKLMRTINPALFRFYTKSALMKKGEADRADMDQ